MKRWGFDALHFRNRKQLICAGGLKRRTTPTVLYNVLCAVYYESIK